MWKYLMFFMLITTPLFAALTAQDETYLKLLKIYDASVSDLQIKQNEKNQALKQIENDAQVSIKTANQLFDPQIDSLRAQVELDRQNLEASK